jgi:hypothetical protein
MNKLIFVSLFTLPTMLATAQYPLTPFEKSEGAECATYTEAIDYFTMLARRSKLISLQQQGPTDAGYPLHVAWISPQGRHNPAEWHQQGKVVILINNSIHPGEPDGTDASLLLARDIAAGTRKLPANVCLGIVPVYNIGGALNRGPYSRVNQNGPAAYGFRGNAQYLDLNRDFTKADSRNAASFAALFHQADPHILIDNHVSDGADYQHTMTLLTTQYDKLGGGLGNWLRSSFEPSVYADMKNKGWDVFPYVNFNAYDLNRGMTQFYDPPRYSSGYAALFQCIGFVPETHMLKPYKERVQSTYDLMVSIIEKAGAQADSLRMLRQQLRQAVGSQASFALGWQPDTSRHTPMLFKGYGRDTTLSEVTGLPRMYYRHDRPFEAWVRFFNYYVPRQEVRLPAAYIIPAGWHKVHERLRQNGVPLEQILSDTTLDLETYRITKYVPATRPYEGHYRYNEVSVSTQRESITLRKGDYIARTGHRYNRFLAEMLEPTGADSYFAWNYFDAILQQKEGYSNYRWEEVAAEWLRNNPALRAQLEAKKKAEPAFAQNANQILQWVYQNSPYFEPGYMRYPIYRLP